MGLRRQLLLTTASLVVITVVISSLAFLQNGARVALRQEALGIASAAFRASDTASLQRLTNRLVAAGGVRSIRVVDTDIGTSAFSVGAEPGSDTDLPDAEARSLRVAVEQRQVESYVDDGAFKVIAPVTDGLGATPTGAVLVAFPSDRLQTSMKQQAQAAVPSILVVLAVCFILVALYVFVFMRPVQQLDAAVTSIENYTFEPKRLSRLVNRHNELGHVARLLARVANAEDGWRRSLEELRHSKDQLEIRVQERTQELQESLERQTAVSEVLKLISRSAFDLPTVTGTLLESAVRLCDAQSGMIFHRGSSGLDLMAIRPGNPDVERTARELASRLDARSLVGRVNQSGELVNVESISVAVTDGDALSALCEQQLGAHAALGVPLVQLASATEGEEATGSGPSGVMVLLRAEKRAFSPVQVELAQTFADQAAIAIENVRLLGEVREKTREVQKLKIEIDQAIREKEVNEIVNAEFFQDLQAKAKRMREQKASNDGEVLVQEAIDAYVQRLKREMAERPVVS